MLYARGFSGGLFMNVNVAILEKLGIEWKGARVYDQDEQIRKGTYLYILPSKGIWKIGQ